MTGYRNQGRRDDKKVFRKDSESKVNKKVEDPKEVENSPVLSAFLRYRNELDKKHDKHERIFKISRDVTIESKRIIFLLHSVTRASTKSEVLSEAKDRLTTLINTVILNISKELENEDQYQFSRAYNPGLQEFIEAYTFYHYLNEGLLYKWENAQNDLIFKSIIKNDSDSDIIESGDKELQITTEESDTKSFSNDDTVINKTNPIDLKVLLTPLNYVLGVLDLIGEIMRNCINSLSSGQISVMYQNCNFIRIIFTGLNAFSRVPSKEFYRKLQDLKQSLMKIEYACYTHHINGSEIPKDMLVDVVNRFESFTIDEDEGFY